MKKVLVAALAMTLSCSVIALGQDTGKASKKSKSSAGNTQTLTGYVTDKKCSSDPAKAKDAACVKTCLNGGDTMAFLNDKDQSVWTVKNPDALKGHEGHHVSVKAAVDSTDNSITVQGKPKMVKEQGSSAKPSA